MLFQFKSQFFRNRDLIVLYNDVSNQLLIKYKIAEIDSCQIKKKIKICNISILKAAIILVSNRAEMVYIVYIFV